MLSKKLQPSRVTLTNHNQDTALHHITVHIEEHHNTDGQCTERHIMQERNKK